MSCPICCENFNKSLNSKIKCPISNCEFEACKTCTRTYLLNTTNDPHCMNCKNQWSNKFVIDNLNRSFVENDYKKHRKQLLVDKEISRTPELMNLVERTKLLEEEEVELKKLNEKLVEARKILNNIDSQVREKKLQIYRIKTGEDNKESKNKFIMPCPGENCKGYLSSQYKCELCKLHTCSHCFELIGYNKDDPHTCSEENLKSAELIKKETKGCPKCGVRIFKISGCDQMWCTECKVAFSWNTGKIVISGAIHNPHYYEHMRNDNTNNVPRNPGDVLCGGLILYHRLNTMLRYINNFSKDWLLLLKENIKIEEYFKKNEIVYIQHFTTIISNLHRHINHITNVDLENARRKVRDLQNNDNLTVQYILNKKSKDELATSVFRNDIMRKKYNELLHIYELLSVVGVERFTNIYNNYEDISKLNFVKNKTNEYNENVNKIVYFIENIVEFLNYYNSLTDYTNNQLKIISYTYNLSVSTIYFHRNNYYFTSEKYKLCDIQEIETKNKKQKITMKHLAVIFNL